MSLNPATWMTDNFEVIGEKTFGQIVIPGSHDSGMSEVHGTTVNITALQNSTKTQSLNVYDQIVSAGMRYLDLRFVYYEASSLSDIPSGYYTAHYTSLVGSTWGGLIGRSLSDICQDLQNAISDLGQNEVVFIALSHGNQLVEGGLYQPLSTSQRSEIINALLTVLKENYVGGDSNTNISTMIVNTPFAYTAGAAFVIWDNDGSYSGTEYSAVNGLFSAANMPVYDSYFATNNQDDFLSQTQTTVQGWSTNQENEGQFFFLSWHLTCANPLTENLETYASSLNPQLAMSLANWQTNDVIPENCNPNFVAWDYVSSEDFGPLQACVDLVDPLNWIQSTQNTSNYIGPLSNYYFNSDPVLIPSGYTLQTIGISQSSNQICLILTVSDGSDVRTISGQSSNNYIHLGNSTGCSDLYASLNPSLLDVGDSGVIGGIGFVLTNYPDDPNSPNIDSGYNPDNQICLAVYNNFNPGYYTVAQANSTYSLSLGGLYLNTNVVDLPSDSVVIGTRLQQQGNQLCLSIAVSPTS